jgi:hypothetical protein
MNPIQWISLHVLEHLAAERDVLCRLSDSRADDTLNWNIFRRSSAGVASSSLYLGSVLLFVLFV